MPTDEAIQFTIWMHPRVFNSQQFCLSFLLSFWSISHPKPTIPIFNQMKQAIYSIYIIILERNTQTPISYMILILRKTQESYIKLKFELVKRKLCVGWRKENDGMSWRRKWGREVELLGPNSWGRKWEMSVLSHKWEEWLTWLLLVEVSLNSNPIEPPNLMAKFAPAVVMFWLNLSHSN